MGRRALGVVMCAAVASTALMAAERLRVVSLTREGSVLVSFEAGGEKSGTFVIKTADDIATVAAFYEEQMAGLGLQVDKASMNVQGAETVNLTGRTDGRTMNVTVSHQEGETQGIIAYSEKN